MMGERDDSEATMVEHCVVPDIFVSGLGRVEEIGGGCLRLTCYVNQRPAERPHDPPEQVVVAKLVAPAGAIAEAIRKMALAQLAEPMRQQATGSTGH